VPTPWELLFVLVAEASAEILAGVLSRLERWAFSSAAGFRFVLSGTLKGSTPAICRSRNPPTPLAARFDLLFLTTGVMNVTTANSLRQRRKQMSTIDSENIAEPASEPAKPKGGSKPAKKAKAAKKAPRTKKADGKPSGLRFAARLTKDLF
jgi:hypothetical protein